MSFTYDDLNEELFEKVVCFSVSWPSGLGGKGSVIMYTEDGKVYKVAQRGFERPWHENGDVFPYTDTMVLSIEKWSTQPVEKRSMVC